MISFPYNAIFLELTSICNAKCPYCLTGRQKGKGKPRFIAPETFDAILEALYRKGYANNDTELHLYIWGEPFLHPRLNELLAIASRHQMPIVLSTNGSIVPQLTPDWKILKRIIFSCPGYSAESCKRIHGFDFERIRENIGRVVHGIRSLGGSTAFSFNFHIYQFNQDELAPLRKFARSLGCTVVPNYAIINDWDLTDRWMTKTLSAEESFAVGRDIFNYLAADAMNTIPPDYACPQEAYLALDVEGNICLCCQTPHEPAFTVGNILDEDSTQKIINRFGSPVCRHCILSGKAHVIHSSFHTPLWAMEKEGFFSRVSRRVKKLRQSASRMNRAFTMRSFAKRWVLPPGWLDILRRFFRAKHGQPTEEHHKCWFTGEYASWAEAERHATGYDARDLQNDIIAAERQVQSGAVPFQRDGSVFPEGIEYTWPLLANLLYVYAAQGGRLDLLDFGGSLGCTYQQNRFYLDRLDKISWNIVEQKQLVDAGRLEFETERIRFWESIEDCLAGAAPDCLLLGSVIEFLEGPYELLESILSRQQFAYVLLDRMAFSRDGQHHLFVLNRPDYMGKASYPCHFLSKSRVYDILSRDYSMIEEYDVESDLEDTTQPLQQGSLWTRR